MKNVRNWCLGLQGGEAALDTNRLPRCHCSRGSEKAKRTCWQRKTANTWRTKLWETEVNQDEGVREILLFMSSQLLCNGDCVTFVRLFNGSASLNYRFCAASGGRRLRLAITTCMVPTHHPSSTSIFVPLLEEWWHTHTTMQVLNNDAFLPSTILWRNLSCNLKRESRTS